MLDCNGQLTGVFSRYLFAETVEGLLEKHRSVVLNLECMQKVDASALGAIASCVRCAIEHRKVIRVFGVKKQVRQMLEVTRLASFLKFYDTEEEAVAAVTACAA